MWSASDDEEVNAIQSLYRDSDRAVGIVAASLVERRLESALLSVLKDDSDVISKLFRSSAPLGSFAAKIRLAYLMRIVSETLSKELEIMKDIRNRFAHDLTAAFDHPPIRDRCNNFALVDEICRDPSDMTRPGTSKMKMAIENCATKLREPRARYLLSAAIFTNALRVIPPRHIPDPWL